MIHDVQWSLGELSISFKKSESRMSYSLFILSGAERYSVYCPFHNVHTNYVHLLVLINLLKGETRMTNFHVLRLLWSNYLYIFWSYDASVSFLITPFDHNL